MKIFIVYIVRYTIKKVLILQNFALHKDFTKYKNNPYTNKNTLTTQRYWLNQSAITDSAPKQKSNNKKSNKIILLLLGLGLLFLSKSGQKKSKHTLEKIKDHLENKVEESFLKESNVKYHFMIMQLIKLIYS